MLPPQLQPNVIEAAFRASASKAAFRDRAKRLVASWLASLGLKNHVNVEVVDGWVADAIGVSVLGRVLGRIRFGVELLYALNTGEQDFVLAHELSHLVSNHSASRLSPIAIRELLLANLDSQERTAARVWIEVAALGAYALGALPLRAEILREHEYQADSLAVVSLTGDLESACSALSKLSGGNMEAPSHTWKVFDCDLPAMTMGVRIAELRRRVAEFRRRKRARGRLGRGLTRLRHGAWRRAAGSPSTTQ